MDKDWVVPKVLYMPLLDVEPSAAAQRLLPEADLGGLPLLLLLDMAEMGALVAEEGREVFSASGWWLLLAPKIQQNQV